MIKQKTVFEITINERSYRLECSPDSPLGELHDALSQMKSFVVERIKEVNDQEAKNG